VSENGLIISCPTLSFIILVKMISSRNNDLKVLALERLEKALDLPSKLVKHCHSQADKGPGNRKGL
jgi:hypothetical protein